MVTIRIRSSRPAMPSISGPRSTVARTSAVTPFVSGAACSLLIALSSRYGVVWGRHATRVRLGARRVLDALERPIGGEPLTHGAPQRGVQLSVGGANP